MSQNRSYKKGAGYRDDPRYIISFEGRKTEPNYFAEVEKLSRFNIIPIHPTELHGDSSPKGVMNRLELKIEELQDVETKKIHNAEVWLVVDVDQWMAHGQLDHLIAQCHGKQWNFAISNPCFEVWLYFHFELIPDSDLETLKCSELKTKVKAFKNQADFRDYTSLIPIAIQNAESVYVQTDNGIPNKGTTQVHLLIKQLLPEG